MSCFALDMPHNRTERVRWSSANFVRDLHADGVAHSHAMVSDIPYSADSVGTRIRTLREAHGMNRPQFAEAIGVQAGEVAAWETGGRRPSVAKCEGMIRNYRVTLDWLFLGDARHLPHDLATRLAAHIAAS